jgi:hypothetical protein
MGHQHQQFNVGNHQQYQQSSGSPDYWSASSSVIDEESPVFLEEVPECPTAVVPQPKKVLSIVKPPRRKNEVSSARVEFDALLTRISLQIRISF